MGHGNLYGPAFILSVRGERSGALQPSQLVAEASGQRPADGHYSVQWHMQAGKWGPAAGVPWK